MMPILWMTISLLVAIDGELLVNPSFEAWREGLPVGWQRYGGGVPQSRVEMAKEAHSGQWAVRFVDEGPEERDSRWSIGLQQDVPVQPGHWYEASVWVKAISRNHPEAVQLQLRFLPGNQLASVWLNPPIGGDWKRFRVMMQAPADAKTARIYLYTIHFWRSETLLDDASLREIPPEVAQKFGPLLFHGSEGVAKVRSLQRETVLVEGGQAQAIIVAPDDADHLAIAQRLQSELQRQMGIALPLRTVPRVRGERLEDILAAHQLPNLRERSILALGSMLNNPIIERLYWNLAAFEDAAFPGKDGFALRTVCQPYNFRLDQNVIVLGGSNATGVTKAVEALLKRVERQGDRWLVPYTLLVEPHKPPSEEERRTIAAPPADFTLFLRYAEQYLRTGEEVYAEGAKRVLLRYWELYRQNPNHRLTWPEETSSFRIGLLWDAIEEAPVFTDEERHICTQTLLMTLHILTRHVYNWGTFAENKGIIWNHQTFPLLGVYGLARYFRRFYGDVDERMDDYLAQVHGAFRGQRNSWKPQEDADSYITLTPNHQVQYELAEGRYDFFANGNYRLFAEYQTFVSDARGYIPGFGDSGYSRVPYLELTALPLAFWFYRDGRYLWRLKHIKPDWVNPYWQDVEPRPWPELIGVHSFPMPRLFYEHFTKQPAYGEPHRPTNVPYEQTFDKIAFREGWEPDSAFLLLDGIATGKHLHYDGNAIVKLSMLGEDLLIDGDYLVRNTTEHNMVSILRNGRAEEPEPIYAALKHLADLPHFGATQTAVYDWNGADWLRTIFWRKGLCFVVLDELKARQEGEFTFECVWKTLEREEQKWFEERTNRIWLSLVPQGGRIGNWGLVRTEDDEASGGWALRFARTDSQLDFILNLPAGEYSLTLIAKGLDTGSDSFWVRVDDGEPAAFHIPVGKFGPSSATHTKDTPTPNVRIKQDGMHRFTITLREAPGPLLDRIMLRKTTGEEVWAAEAEDAPPIPEEQRRAAPTVNLYLVGDGSGRAKVTRRINNVGLRIRKVHERLTGQLQHGDGRAFLNLLYAEHSKAPLALRLHRLGPREGLLLRHGEPIAYFGTGQQEATRALLPIDAALFWVEADWAAVVAGTQLGKWRSIEPKTVELPALTDVKSLLRRLARFPAWLEPHTEPSPSTAQVRLPLIWKQEPPVVQPGEPLPIVNDVAWSDGRLFVAQGRFLRCFDGEGKELWRFRRHDALQAVWVGDLDGDGKTDVLTGGDEETLFWLDANGRLLRRLPIEAPLRIGTSSVARPKIRTILCGRLTDDGPMRLFVGTANGNLIAYDVELKMLWRFDQIEHGTIKGALVDLDGDGKREIIVGNRYGSVEIFDADGKQVENVYSELGDVEFALGDLDGDGQMEVVNGSSTGELAVKTFRGRERWRFCNFGYANTALAVADVDGDGKMEVIVASETGYLYAINAQGQVKATYRASDAVRAMLLLPDAQGYRLVIGGDDGRIILLDGRLRPLGVAELPEKVVGIWLIPKPQLMLLAAAEDGVLCTFSLGKLKER